MRRPTVTSRNKSVSARPQIGEDELPHVWDFAWNGIAQIIVSQALRHAS